MSDAQLLHEMAKGLAEVKGISEDQAIRLIREEYTQNSELHLKIPQLQPQPYQPQKNASLESTRDLIAKGSARSDAAQAGSQSSALEMRRLELEERRLDVEQRRYDAEQKREDALSQERKDNLEVERRRVENDNKRYESDQQFKRDELKAERESRRDELKLERETARADQKFSQILALGQGKGSDEIMKMVENQSTVQREYFKEINTVKDSERQHTDQLRTDLAKIESDRDVELAKLKATSDNDTATAIDTLVSKMDTNFKGIMDKSNGSGDDDFLDQYNKQIEKVSQFQKNLTDAGLNTLRSQGVDIEALKKAHNIASNSEESTLDKIIGVGKDLYEKTIKPGMEQAAKNGSGSGTNAPSGLETAFETPDNDMEDRIRAEQKSQDQITLAQQDMIEQENASLKNELAQYETDLYNKAAQYGIHTHDLSTQELESTITQYETIMSTPFNSAPQTKSIVGMRHMASELKINTSGKTVGQVENEVVQAQLIIEQQLDSLQDNVPEPQPEPVQEHETEPPAQEEIITEPTHDIEPEQPLTIEPEPQAQEPVTETDPEPNVQAHNTEYSTQPQEPEQPVQLESDDTKSSGQKRSITAQHTLSEKTTRESLKKFTTSDGTEIEGKNPKAVATQLAKDLNGTSDHPEIVELTDEDGNKFVYETRIDQFERKGKIVNMPRAKLVY